MFPRDRSISKLNPVSAYLIFSPSILRESAALFLINHWLQALNSKTAFIRRMKVESKNYSWRQQNYQRRPLQYEDNIATS